MDDFQFMFSARTATESLADIDKQINAIENYVDKLTDATIGGQYIIPHLLKLEPSSEELAALGKNLTKISTHWDKLAELRRKRQVLETASKNPTWLAAVLGDFSKDFASFEASLNEG